MITDGYFLQIRFNAIKTNPKTGNSPRGSQIQSCCPPFYAKKVSMKEIQLNQQQQEAVSHRDGLMIVFSVAGSGKTMVLTERIIHLIENGIDPARLLAITFAKKATIKSSQIKANHEGLQDFHEPLCPPKVQGFSHTGNLVPRH
jgi:hypothetical protein